MPGKKNEKEMPPEITHALGTCKMSTTEIHERLHKFADNNYAKSFSLKELRDTLSKEMGDRSLTAELRNLRDEE